jgi:hypothetical protein
MIRLFATGVPELLDWHPHVHRAPDPHQGELFAGLDLGDAPPCSKPSVRRLRPSCQPSASRLSTKLAT